MKLNLQQAFDKILIALRQQKVRSGDVVTCLYRSPNGNKCAIGHLIPDADCPANVDSLTLMEVEHLLNGHGLLDQTVDYSKLKALQEIHDNWMPYRPEMTMSSWEVEMAGFALANNLTYTSPSHTSPQ